MELDKKVAIFDWEWGLNSAPWARQKIFPCWPRLLLSSEYLSNQFGLRSAPTECWSWPGSKLFDTMSDSVLFEKSQQAIANA